MATYRQDEDHDRITHMDMLNLLRQDMREGFAQQREVFNARFDAFDSKIALVDGKIALVDGKVDAVNNKVDAVDDKVDAVNNKVERHFVEHTEQANESKTGRRWLIGIAIGVGIAVVGLIGQYLPAIIQALQSGS